MIAEPSNWVFGPYAAGFAPSSINGFVLFLLGMPVYVKYFMFTLTPKHYMQMSKHLVILASAFLLKAIYYDLVSHNPSVIDSEFLMRKMKKRTKLIRSRPKTFLNQKDERMLTTVELASW